MDYYINICLLVDNHLGRLPVDLGDLQIGLERNLLIKLSFTAYIKSQIFCKINQIFIRNVKCQLHSAYICTWIV